MRHESLSRFQPLRIQAQAFQNRKKNAGHRDERRDGLLFPPEQRECYIHSAEISRFFLCSLLLPIRMRKARISQNLLPQALNLVPGIAGRAVAKITAPKASTLMNRYGS
jgi:hypothetical protein